MKMFVVLLGLLSTFFTSIPTQAQSIDTLDKKDTLRFSTPQLYFPTATIITEIGINCISDGFIKHQVADFRNSHLTHFSTKADNYLQFSPLAITYGLEAIGIRGKTDFYNLTAITLKGELIRLASVQLLKMMIKEQRPDGSDNQSFPSGHTAQAFAGAVLLSEEYKDRFPWLPYVSYGLATTVGVMRVANNKHYIGDVMVGAGIGILSMKLSYWLHAYKWGRKNKVLEAPF